MTRSLETNETLTVKFLVVLERFSKKSHAEGLSDERLLNIYHS